MKISDHGEVFIGSFIIPRPKQIANSGNEDVLDGDGFVNNWRQFPSDSVRDSLFVETYGHPKSLVNYEEATEPEVGGYYK